MHGAWVRFIADAPPWTPYAADSRRVMHFDAGEQRVLGEPYAATLARWPTPLRTPMTAL